MASKAEHAARDALAWWIHSRLQGTGCMVGCEWADALVPAAVAFVLDETGAAVIWLEAKALCGFDVLAQSPALHG